MIKENPDKAFNNMMKRQYEAAVEFRDSKEYLQTALEELIDGNMDYDFKIIHVSFAEDIDKKDGIYGTQYHFRLGKGKSDDECVTSVQILVEIIDTLRNAFPSVEIYPDVLRDKREGTLLISYKDGEVFNINIHIPIDDYYSPLSLDVE